jgi:hypothetical protein
VRASRCLILSLIDTILPEEGRGRGRRRAKGREGREVQERRDWRSVRNYQKPTSQIPHHLL